MAQKKPPARAGKASRQAAAEAVRLVLYEQSYLDPALVKAIGKGQFDQRDTALIRAIATTTLRRLGEIRQALATHMKKPLADKLSAATCVLYTSVAQICFMNTPNHSAIDSAVEILRTHRKHKHLAGMANAVLRKISASSKSCSLEPDDPRINTPKWLWQIWAKDHGKPAADAIARAHLHQANLDISLKPECDERPDGSILPGGTLRVTNAAEAVESLPGYKKGNWWVQDFAAALAAKLLDNVHGKTVLDLCAAPGGKTLQLASRGGHVTALDISEKRLARLRDNLSRTRLGAQIVCADALTWQTGQTFDAILLDAPCSATGTIRRHPDAPYLKKSSDIESLSRLQAHLLDKAAQMLKPHGTLVYCTCSLQKREGEAQIDQFLARNTDFDRKKVDADELGGLSQLINDNGDVRTLPFYAAGDSTGMDGFFISRLTRKS